MDVKTLIEEVLADIGNNKTLTEVSSKIQIIVRLLGDDKFRACYHSEFVAGYKGEDFPDYRISQAADIKADYLMPQGAGVWQIKGQSVPVANLGFEKYKEIMAIRLGDSIPAIIEYSRHPDNMIMSLTPYEPSLVQDVLVGAQIQRVYKVLSPSTFQTIIDNVQGRIIDTFMDLNESILNGQLDIHSSEVKKEISQVINNNFTAGVIQTGPGTIGISHSSISTQFEGKIDEELRGSLNSLLNKIEEVAKTSDDEFNGIAQEIVDIRSELQYHSPNTKSLITSFKALMWGASVSCKAAIEKLVGNAIDLLTN